MLAIDGDTIIDNGERVRIMGFNAPELHSPACLWELAQAYRAKLFLQAWLERKPVLIRLGRDKYGRTLARMQPDPGPDMIAKGLAEPYECPAGRCPKRKDWCRD